MTSYIARTGLAQDLVARAQAGPPVRIGLIGCGEMGTDIVAGTCLMDGIEVAAIAEIRSEAARQAVDSAFREPGHARHVETRTALDATIESGQIAITGDAGTLLESCLVDVVVEATGLPGVGAQYGLTALECGKHLVMMNVEADVTVGPWLKAQADRLGKVYSLGAGDEPSACMELIEFVTAMGHEVIVAGKAKNNPLRIDATPDQYEEEAARRKMNPRMLVEFVDGSKTMVEMAALANATGLVPDRPGMHGPQVSAADLASVLVPGEEGGILSGPGRVDYSLGKGLAPGVFVVTRPRHPRVAERMEDLKMGKGPCFAFIRPYHLTSLEVPLTCARAVLYGKADMVPLAQPVAEVCALAKRDLAPGDTLGQIGEYDYRAWIMEAGEARGKNAVPCGLLAGGSVTRPVRKGALLTQEDVTPDASSEIVRLRALQDQMTGAQE